MQSYANFGSFANYLYLNVYLSYYIYQAIKPLFSRLKTKWKNAQPFIICNSLIAFAKDYSEREQRY